MSRRRRQQKGRYLAADIVARYLFHVHGVDPVFADDFRDANEGTYSSVWGDVELNVSNVDGGADSVGGVDGGAVNSPNQNNPAVSATPSGEMDPQDKDFTQLVFYRPRTIEPTQEFLFRMEGPGSGEAVVLHDDASPPRTKMTIVDDSGMGSSANNSNAVAENELNLTAQIAARGQNFHRNFGRRPGIASTKVAGGALNIGGSTGINDVRLFEADCSAQLAALQLDFVSVPQFNYIYEILTDRTSYAPQLDRWTHGTPEGGHKRRTPDRVNDETVFWWDARRQVRHVDGEGITQLTDFSGSNHVDQWTDTDKAIANGSSVRGEPLDSATWNGSSVSYILQDQPTQPQHMLIWGVAQDTDTDGTLQNRRLFQTTRDGGFIDFGFNPPNLTWFFTPQGDSGVRLGNSLDGSDARGGFGVVLGYIDVSAKRAVLMSSANGGSFTQRTDGSFSTMTLEPDWVIGGQQVTAGAGTSNQWEGPIKEIGIDVNRPYTDAELIAKRDELMAEYGI